MVLDMTRPQLNEIPIPEDPFKPGTCTITVSPGQWDGLIKAFYEHGHLLLEIDEVNGEERPVRAFRLNESNEEQQCLAQ